VAKGKKSKSRVISRQGGPARDKSATTAPPPPPVDEPVAADAPVVAEGTDTPMADWSTPRPERTDRTVKKPILGGVDGDLPYPLDAMVVIAMVYL
jgi:hypothetical protein